MKIAVRRIYWICMSLLFLLLYYRENEVEKRKGGFEI